ncbi:myosin-3-like [Apium graveolens]|uniref:myosin-3-like n=1 Tax=Apium graveolens TaxID=4045 RepID=UPI003D7922AD
MSTLELMLEKLQQTADHNAEDLPPALPVRPISKARLPPGKKCWPVNLQSNNSTRKDILVSMDSGFKSPEKIDVKEANGKCFFQGDTNGYLIQKTDIGDYTREKELQRILGTQTYFHGHCHEELIRGIITLQSFVRAENARNIASRTLQTRHRAVLLLQSVARGWLIRRHLKFTEKNDSRRQKAKDCVHVPYCDVYELQRRVLKTEAALENKKEEKFGLLMKIAQFEKQWQQHEAKMKSMEKMWQEQLTCIQVSLAEVASKTQSAEKNANEITMVDSAPLLCDANGGSFSFFGESGSDENSVDELRKLKLQFETWKKDYKSQLHKTKATFQKLGTSKVKKSSKKWWER